MRYFPPTLVLSALTAESEPSGRSYTVDELITDRGLVTAMIEKCWDRCGDSTNCGNAEAADGKLRLQRTRQSLGG